MHALLRLAARPIVAVSLLLSGCIEPTTLRVDSSTGVDADGCGRTPSGPCKTVSYALRLAGPGDTIALAPGEYRERLSLTKSGNDDRPITVSCSGAPGACIISGAGMAPEALGALIRISAANVSLVRLSVSSIPARMYAVALADAQRVELRDLRLEGNASSEALIVTSGKTDWVTLVRSSLSNCPPASSGCAYWHNVSHLAVIGNEFGPVTGGGNFDCNTVIGTTVGLIDGNTCRDSVDGFDHGMDQEGVALDRVIVRYNSVGGAIAGRAFPVSGQYEGKASLKQFLTGRVVFYKNLVAVSGGTCFQAYGGARNILIAQNTCFTAGAYGSGLWLQTEWDAFVDRVFVRSNIFDGPDSALQPVVVLGSVPSTVSACPISDPCPFVNNALGYSSRSESSEAVSWAPSAGGAGLVHSFSFGDWQTTWNSEPNNAGNRRVDPRLKDRSKLSIDGLYPAQGSPLVDAGLPFCRASSAGTGITVEVTCDAPADPTVLFPVRSDFYRVLPVDCSGVGLHLSGAPGSECFDVQVEGCGVRSVTSATPTSVTLSGQPCSWERGARVHVPWVGLAPDIGALEGRL